MTTTLGQFALPIARERPGLGTNVVDRWMLGIIVAATAAMLAYVSTAPVADVIFRVTDDAYYYFKVAALVAAGEGLTFDGVNSTNGFHPLWMLCLVPIYWVFGAEGESGLRAALALVTLVAGGTFWVAYSCIRAYAGRAAAVVGAGALLAPICLNPLLNGLETGLLTLLLFGVLWACRKAELLSLRAGLGKNVVLGVLLALVFLCRLDTAFFVLAVVGLIGLRWVTGCEGKVPVGRLLGKYLQVGLVGLAFTGPYLLWNLVKFGHLTPLSGALKSSFPTLSFSVDKFDKPYVVLAVAELGLALIVFAWLRWRNGGRGAEEAQQSETRIGGREDILLALWVGCGVHLLNTLLFMNWAVHWWHFASYVPLAVVAGALLFACVHEALRRSPCVLALGVVGVLGASAYGLHWDAQRRGAHHAPWYQAALWARANLPDEAVVGMTDCGLVGYFCGRPTINLDGVINGYEYQAALRDGRLSDYLSRCGVTHIADYEVSYTEGEYVVRLPARLHREAGGALVAGPEAEVYRSEPYSDSVHRGGGIHFAIWDLRLLRIVNDATELAAAPTGAKGE